jgi:hypothetical protein
LRDRIFDGASMQKKSDPSVLRDKLFQKACPEVLRDRIFDGASMQKKSDFFKNNTR